MSQNTGTAAAQDVRTQHRPAGVAPRPAFSDGPINILIVDDEPRNLTVLETVLDDPGYRLIRAESADEALLALVEEEFALLILDIRMPGMTGLELAQMIKGRKKTARVPIIFLTAYYNEDQHVLAGYVNGAVDYLHKPVNAAILRSKVSIFAELHRKNRESAIANRALLAEVSERRRAEEQLRELTETLEQRVAERTEALREAHQKLQNVMSSITDGLMMLDKNWRYTYFSDQGARMLGMRPEQLLGGCIWELFPHTRGTKFYEGFHRAAESGQAVTFEEFYPEPFNQWFQCHCYPSAEGLSVYFHDVSERKRAELERNDAMAAATKANLAKSDFLSSMSHELRTPLSAILGFAQLMESASPPPTTSQKRSIDQILKAGWYLLELINEILDLAVIESGKVSLSVEVISLAALMHECRAMIEAQAKRRGISMVFPEFEIPYFVMADRTRVKQVLINLLSNAIKYNKAGGAVVVDCIMSSPERLRVGVKDSGQGLTPEDLAQLFQPFNRLEQAGKAEGGTGIGLVVCKRLVELMGGGIGVESTPGEGSLFWFELNLAAPPKPALPAAQATALARANVQAGAPLRTLLYVEDNPANVMLVEDFMARRPEFRLLSAADGHRGVEMACACFPDIILMDINLPGISGLAALRTLADNTATAHIPVVALSANAMPRDIEKGLEAGFFRYLTKPIKIKEFMDTLDAALKVSQAQLARADEKAVVNSAWQASAS